MVQYVRDLPQPETLPSSGRASEHLDHVGAKLADAALQRGTNYENNVRHRVERIAREFPQAAIISGLVALLDERGAGAVLDLSGGPKLRTFEDLARELLKQDVEAVADLRALLSDRWRANRLRRIDGVGAKTVSFLKLLVGLDAVAVDMHILAALEAAEVAPCDPSEVESLFRLASEQLGRPMRDLDAIIWRHHSSQARERR